MHRENGRNRQAQLLHLYQTVPPVQQGVIVCVLLGNALLLVTLDGVIVVAAIRGAVRSWRHRRLGPLTALRTGVGPVLCGALAASAIQRVVVRGLFRAVDTGRAVVWLERSERWLAAGAPDEG